VSDLHRPTRVYSTAVTHSGTRAICTQCPDIEVSTQVSPSTAASTHPIVAIQIVCKKQMKTKGRLLSIQVDCGTTSTRGQSFWCAEQEIKQALFCSLFQVWIICTILQLHDTRAHTHTRPGVAKWLRRCAASRRVSGSIPGGVARDFFRTYRRNHVPSSRLSL
jgi:hypothetical protein